MGQNRLFGVPVTWQSSCDRWLPGYKGLCQGDVLRKYMDSGNGHVSMFLLVQTYLYRTLALYQSHQTHS